MIQKRVLVVDDLPDVCVTVAGMIRDEGYYTKTATSLEESKAILLEERFHVGVFDMRLDETDEDNQDGLVLLEYVNQHYPTMLVIVLTGYATVKTAQKALQPNRDGKSPAFNFLEKTQYDDLIDAVEDAFLQIFKSDTAIRVNDSTDFLSKLPKKIRFRESVKPSNELILEETLEVLQIMFHDCEQIDIWPTERGYSGVVILRVKPCYQNRGEGEMVIAKIGEKGLVQKELDRYERYVRGIVGGHRVPQALSHVNTHHLSGILYTFAGMGQITDFSTFYKQSELHRVESALEKLYNDTCKPWRMGKSKQVKDFDLGKYYLEQFRLSEKNISSALKKMMGGRHPFKYADGMLQLGEQMLPDPVKFCLQSDFIVDSCFSYIHGDLYGHNVLVDQHDHSWLIDFADTGEGPLIQDYVSFEAYLKYNLLEQCAWDQFLLWEQALVGAEDLCNISLPDDVADNARIEKMHYTILKLRTLAWAEIQGCELFYTYLVTLLFNGLRVMTIMSLPPMVRDRAIISAAVVTQRLLGLEGK